MLELYEENYVWKKVCAETGGIETRDEFISQIRRGTQASEKRLVRSGQEKRAVVLRHIHPKGIRTGAQAGEAKPSGAPLKKAKGGSPLRLMLPVVFVLAIAGVGYFAYTRFFAAAPAEHAGSSH